MIDKTCKNCVYWEKIDDITICGWNDWADKRKLLKDEDFEVHVYSDDDSGLVAHLRTGTNFGCVLFQEKNKQG